MVFVDVQILALGLNNWFGYYESEFVSPTFHPHRICNKSSTFPLYGIHARLSSQWNPTE